MSIPGILLERVPGRLRLGLAAFACGALVIGCGETGPPAGETRPADADEREVQGQNGSALLDAIIEKYVNQKRAESSRSELPDVSVQAFVQKIESDRRLLRDIRAIDSQSLTPAEDIDRRLLVGLLESGIYSAEKRRMWEIDPGMYVPAAQVGRLLASQSAESGEESLNSLQALLERLPLRLAEGKANLKNPPRRFTEAAIFQSRGTTASLRNSAAELAEQGAGDRVFTASLDTAIEALADYERFLEDDLLPRSTGDWAIGKEHYDYILQHRWLMDTDADAILERGLLAFEETGRLAQEVSERIEPGKHWSEVYERLKDQHPEADAIKDAYQSQIEAAQAFVKANHIVTLPDGERVITVDTPPAMRRSSPFGTFQSVDQFDDGLEGRLVLTPIEDWMTPEQQAQRLRSHHDAWIPIIAVHEAYPGHHVDALKTRENPRILRKVVREPIFSEGWGLFTEELMYELGFLQGDDVRLTQLRNRLWRAARVILDVSMHTRGMSFDEAVEFLSEKVRFERYAAELEVGMYTLRPTYVLGYLIGMQEIMKIREEYIARFGHPVPPARFYDQLLGIGSLPPALVRDALFQNVSGDRTGEGK